MIIITKLKLKQKYIFTKSCKGFVLTDPISLTLISRCLKGVFTNPIALARRSPHVGGFSAFIADHTPAGGFCNGADFIPHPEIFKLKIVIKFIKVKK